MRTQSLRRQKQQQSKSRTWPSEDKTFAQRWLIEAPLLALPSENLKSYQAMCGISKHELLTTAHEELSHTGGRDAIVTALTEEGKKWNNMAVDAQWVVNRCEATTTEVWFFFYNYPKKTQKNARIFHYPSFSGGNDFD